MNLDPNEDSHFHFHPTNKDIIDIQFHSNDSNIEMSAFFGVPPESKGGRIESIPHSDPHLLIKVLDEKGPGGASHEYAIYQSGEGFQIPMHFIHFQKGPIKEVGVNGITNEVLLEIVKHRLQCFQDGSFPCKENEVALEHVSMALKTLEERTANRRNRGVEGTYQQ